MLKTQGFSIVEILVSIALISILSGIGVSLYAIINNSYATAQDIAKVQAQGSAALEIMERSLRNSIQLEFGGYKATVAQVTLGGKQYYHYTASGSAIGGASNTTYTCPTGTMECMRMFLHSDAADFIDGCPVVEYGWIAPQATSVNNLTNGRIWQKYQTADYSDCPSQPQVDLFDTDNKTGVSVERLITQGGQSGTGTYFVFSHYVYDDKVYGILYEATLTSGKAITKKAASLSVTNRIGWRNNNNY